MYLAKRFFIVYERLAEANEQLDGTVHSLSQPPPAAGRGLNDYAASVGIC